MQRSSLTRPANVPYAKSPLQTKRDTTLTVALIELFVFGSRDVPRLASGAYRGQSFLSLVLETALDYRLHNRVDIGHDGQELVVSALHCSLIELN